LSRGLAAIFEDSFVSITLKAFAAAACLAASTLIGAGAAGAATPTERPAARAASNHLIIHKTPWCGCCSTWAEQAKAAGFTIEMRDYERLDPIKDALGVPPSQASCHTAEIDGYFVEGHVPFEDIRRMLAERPAALGIAVPGMPQGSPGMESPNPQAYSVNLVGRDGSTTEYARHNVRD
jgi:hypothetical protein